MESTGLVAAPYYFERVAILSRKARNFRQELHYCESYIRLVEKFYDNMARRALPMCGKAQCFRRLLLAFQRQENCWPSPSGLDNTGLISARQKTPGFLTRRGTGVGVCPDQSGARNAISVIFAKVRPVMRRSPALHAKFSRPRRCGVAFSTMSEVVGRVRRPCGAASAEGRPDAAPAAAGADRSGAGSPPGWTAQPSARSRPPPCSALGQGPAARDC